MKKYYNNDPACLYRDCYEYVVACTMANCPHLTREWAEDITSDAFVSIYTKRVANIQNWIWKAKMMGFLDFSTRISRYSNDGISSTLPDGRFEKPAFFEVFKPRELLVRKDAKACYDYMMKGYNRAEIAKALGRTKQGVTTMIYRLRKQVKIYLADDIKLYHRGK